MANRYTVVDTYTEASTLTRQASCCVDRQGIILSMSPALRELLKLGSEEKMLKIIDIDPATSILSWQTFWEELEEIELTKQHSKLLTTDMKIIDITVVSKYVQSPEVDFCYLVFQDTSSPDNKELALSVPDRMMRYSVDNAKEMIFWVDKEGFIVYINKQVSLKTGYSRKEAYKLKAWEFLDEVKNKEGWTLFFDKVKEIVRCPVETKQLRKDGETNYVDTISTYIVFEEKEYIFSIVMDISKKKERELALQKALEATEALKIQLENERNYLQDEIKTEQDFNEIITQNIDYQKILKQVEQVAATDATVLISGETGTGKELIARAVHNLSERWSNPMIKVNCAALPPNLIESELFGHEKGAFTGAYKQKIGRFELADKGTIFLDEIGEMPLELQVKILRTLQEGEISRLGSNEMIKVDVRVICATNRDLKQMTVEGTFREDLYYRLNVFPIYNIPLRERRDDIEPLVKFFMKKYGKKIGKPNLKVSKANLIQLMNYEFPGNIRELQNIIERATILSNKEVLNLNAVLPALEQETSEQEQQFLSLEELQRRHIVAALKQANWKVTGKNSAAELLGINGKTLVSRMKKLNIKRVEQLI